MSFFKELIQMSLTSVPIILFVMFVRFCVKRAPKIFSYALWGIVLFRLLCPISFTSDFSFIGLLEQNTQKSLVTEITANETVAPTQNPIRYNLPGNTFEVVEPPLEATAEKPTAIDFYGIAFYFWISGMSALLIYNLISYVILKKRLTVSVCMFDSIYAADYISAPFVVGILKPKIYLPSNISQSNLDYVIAHEKHHIKRNDHIIKLISFFALCLHWFNPLVWLSFSLAVRDMEMSCDEAVLKKLETDKRADYSTTLLSLSVPTKHFAPSPISFGEGNTKVRIKNIMKYKKTTFPIAAAAIVICIATALFLTANPSPELPSPFGATYRACEVTYHQNNLSMIVTIDNSPKVTFTEDNLIILTPNIDSVNISADIKSYGPVEKTKLTKENFDDYFSHTSLTEHGWRTDSHSAKKIRKNNLNTWQFITNSGDTEGNSFYILQQKNGDIYFAVWAYDEERENDPHSDDSFIHTLYQLIPVTEENIPEYTYDFSDAKIYTYPESIESVMKPTVSLSEKNKTFHFTYSMFSSYIAIGNYTEENGKLILDCGDGNIFTFRKTDEGTLVFMQNESSPIPKYRYSADSHIALSPVPDGAVFTNMDIAGIIVENPPHPDDSDAFEKAVSSAIIQNYRGYEPDGLIHTEYHKILDTDEIHGLRTIDGEKNIRKKNVYAIVMHTSYSVDGNELKEVSCDFSPAIIKFVMNSDDSLTFDSYHIPGENGGFRKEVTNYFTEASFEEALKYREYRDEFSKLCLEGAIKIFNGYRTEYTEIEELIKTICSSPAWSSSPGDYISEHPEQYERLIKGENNTLGYCFSRFFAGNETGLEGHIMAQVCHEIIENRGETIHWDYYATGQEWFDAFYKNANVLKEKHTKKELELMFPGTYVLLGTISSQPQEK